LTTEDNDVTELLVGKENEAVAGRVVAGVIDVLLVGATIVERGPTNADWVVGFAEITTEGFILVFVEGGLTTEEDKEVAVGREDVVTGRELLIVSSLVLAEESLSFRCTRRRARAFAAAVAPDETSMRNSLKYW